MKIAPPPAFREILRFSAPTDVNRLSLFRVQIGGKFVCLQTVLMIVGVQRSVIAALVQAGLIHCAPPLPDHAVADRKNWGAYSPSKNARDNTC